MEHPITDEVRYKLLKYLDEHPSASQRELARELGVSLGKVNYCLRALMDKGLLKARNFKNNTNKVAYAYVLTPRGIEEKVNVTRSFLSRKIAEYDALHEEIAALRAEMVALKKEELA